MRSLIIYWFFDQDIKEERCRMKQREIQVDERLPLLQSLPLSFQHLFAMFGSTVLVPLLFGVNPAIILLMNGIGTLIYIFITKGKIPAYLGSSFAFISPVTAVLGKYSGIDGYAHALGGFLLVGIVLVIVGIIVKFIGTSWIDVIFPPAAMGAIVAVIGLELVPTAADMAGLITAKGVSPDSKVIAVSLLTLGLTVIYWVTLRGFLKIIPILLGIVSGYVIAAFFGLVDFSLVREAKWFALPTVYSMKINWADMLIILPAALVLVPEHIGHLIVTGNIVKKDMIKDPGLDRSFMGNGISTIISSFVGATPNTTYGENIGVLAISKVYSTLDYRRCGCTCCHPFLLWKISSFNHVDPYSCYGRHFLVTLRYYCRKRLKNAVSGLRMLVESKVDYSVSQNLILTCVVLAIGISGAAIKIGSVELAGMGLATIVAIILSLFFKILEKFKLSND